MRLSIIVPVLNEANALPFILGSLGDFLQRGCEIIVVDGGSRDESVAIAEAAGFKVWQCSSGRAKQMNHGAAQARGEALLFLHADTRLPDRADEMVLDALRSGAQQWGRFDVTIVGQAFLLELIAAMMNLRSRLSGVATGDQGIFVRRKAFRAIGGFPDQALMEDVEFSVRMKSLSAPACLRAKVKTSGRRWEQNGVLRTVVLMWWLRLAYYFGADATRLAKLYSR
jgi:rSAM/selenodomain-associated transferase 2